MAQKIKIRRGVKSSLPILEEGELGFATDTYETYIGDGSSNHKFISDNDIVTSVSDPGSDSLIPSEQAVRESLNAIEYTDSDVDAHLSGGTGINYSTGTISIDSSVLQNSDVDDTPVDTANDVPISSNWAYDHINTSDAHHSRYTLTEDLTSGEISQLQNINTVTITNTQWGYLGNMSGQPVESSSEIDHGSVSGLGDDDHNQYLLANGTRDVGGDMNWTSENAAQFGSTFEVKYNSDSNSLDFNYIG